MSQYTVIGFTYDQRLEDLAFQSRVDQAIDETTRVLMHAPHKMHDVFRVVIRIHPELAPEPYCALY